MADTPKPDTHADDRVETEVLVWGIPHTLLLDPEDLARFPDPANDYGNGVAPAPGP